ncbi:MAG: HAD family hydrolase [Syntrophobacterales bacterium]|nr:HAD family hydrolase [Syntrophobacterales bacterium]
MIVWLSKESLPPLERPFIFLDRDGVINEERAGFIRRWEDVVIYPDSFPSLLKALSLGFRLVIISNQSGIGRGYIKCEDFWTIHKNMIDTFEKRGIFFSAALYCPHHPQRGCKCRKPSPEMIFFASEVLGGSLSHSFFIGDRYSDVEAANLAGCSSILLRRSHLEYVIPPRKSPTAVCKNLIEAVDLIEKLGSERECGG